MKQHHQKSNRDKPLTSGEASDLIAAEILRRCPLTSGPSQLWLIYDRDSGTGLSYFEGHWEQKLWLLPDEVGVAQVPESLRNALVYVFGPTAFRYVNGAFSLPSLS